MAEVSNGLTGPWAEQACKYGHRLAWSISSYQAGLLFDSKRAKTTHVLMTQQIWIGLALNTTTLHLQDGIDHRHLHCYTCVTPAALNNRVLDKTLSLVSCQRKHSI
jgi:hypothetical protein